MTQELLKQRLKVTGGLSVDWIEPGFYKLAGAGVALTVASVLVDMGLTFAGGDIAVGTLTAEGWFAFFQEHPFIGLRNLGLLNVINALLMLPLYLVLYRLHRRGAPAFASLIFALYLLGTAVYLANNQALGMLGLSSQYVSVAEAQRAQIAAAGTVLLAQAEDFTPGTYLGFFLNHLAPLLMMVQILRGGLFRKRIGVVGLIGMSCLFLFTTLVTFMPQTLTQAMVLAMVGGLVMLGWDITMALQMFRMGSVSDSRENNTVTLAAGTSAAHGD